jgi:pyridoxine/pyridoxamine 5'-phosphate oxidase
MKKSEKSFDCIAYKRATQLQIYEEIKGLSREEEIAYFHKRAETGSLKDWWLRQKSQVVQDGFCADKEVAYTAKQ